MNTLITIFIALTSLFQNDLTSVRKNFEKAENSKESTATLYHDLKNYNRNDFVIQAYKGAAYALQARYVEDRKSKKELFVSGVKDLEAAIVSSPKNIEIRLIRLIIQENSPKILKYKMHIDADKRMILSNFASQTGSIKEAIRRYATKRSKLFTAVEIRTLTK